MPGTPAGRLHRTYAHALESGRYWVSSGRAIAASDDVEMGWCEFTDCHDGLWLLGIRTLRLHQSLVNNFNGDGLEFGPKRPGRKLFVYQNPIARCLVPLTLHGTWHEVLAEEGIGVYRYRNIIE